MNSTFFYNLCVKNSNMKTFWIFIIVPFFCVTYACAKEHAGLNKLQADPEASKQNVDSSTDKIVKLLRMLPEFMDRVNIASLPRWIVYPAGIAGLYYVTEQAVLTAWSTIKPWLLGKTTVDLSARTVSHHLASDFTSFVKELRKMDLVDTLLRMLRVPEQDDCRRKAACEAGAWFLHRRPVMATFLRVMRAYLAEMTHYFTDVMQGLTGKHCDTVFPRCERNFVMSR